VIEAMTRITEPTFRRDPLGRPIDLGLDANECVGGPMLPMRFEEVLVDAARYPDRAALERTIAAREGIDAARIVATAGGDDAIDRICRAVLGPNATMVVTDPTFPMFRHFGEATGAKVRSVPWLDGAVPIDAIAETARDADLIAIATPANPTGTTMTFDEMSRLRASCPNPVFLLDLAYAEFAAADRVAFEEILEHGRRLPRTVIVRTLSKAWGLAGLRVGWADADPAFARRLRDAGGPFPIARPSLAIADAALSDPVADQVVFERVRAISVNRMQIASTVTELGLSCVDGRANFLLVGDSTAEGAARTSWLADGLAATGIAVRRFEQGSIADRVRITIPAGQGEGTRLDSAMRATLRPDGVLFDLDGVLADVSGSYRTAIRRTAAEFGVEVGPEDIDRIKAEGDANDDWEVVRRLLLERGVTIAMSDIVDRFQSAYLGDGDRPGLRETESCTVDPDVLAAAVKGRPIGIVTGRPRAEAEWFLRRSGLDRVIDTVIAREDAPLKPDPSGVVAALDRLDLESAWFLGDTIDDLVAARAVRNRCVIPIGIRPPGLPTERRDEFDRTLLRAGAARVLDAGRPLIDLLQDLLP
jgi:histidinol-phosphate aminotransferase